MKQRIVLWSVAGFFIAGFWAVYLATAPAPMSATQPFLWSLARVSCPIVFISSYYHVGLYFYWILLANAFTYGLAGLTVEALCQPAIHREQAKRAQ